MARDAGTMGRGCHSSHRHCPRLPGLVWPLHCAWSPHHASPIHGTRASRSPDKAPEGLLGKMRFYFSFPRDCLALNEGAGSRPGHWQGTGMRQDAPHLTEAHVPPGLALLGGVRAPTVLGSQLPLQCCPSLRPRAAAWGFVVYW